MKVENSSPAALDVEEVRQQTGTVSKHASSTLPHSGESVGKICADNSEVQKMLQIAKRVIERFSGCRIYRNALPHGVDCFVDIGKRFGRDAVKVVFDVGANVGQSAVEFSRQFPQAEIYCFEPVATTYRELAATVHYLPRARAFNFGMGNETGEALIHVGSESSLNSIKVGLPGDRIESIKLTTIAGFALEHGLESIDFLKIDTEGYDLEVLRGAGPLLLQQKIHFIFAECSPSAARCDRFVTLSALEGFLESFGYKLFGIYDQRFPGDDSNALCWWNALFICGKLIAHGSKLEEAND